MQACVDRHIFALVARAGRAVALLSRVLLTWSREAGRVVNELARLPLLSCLPR